MALEGVSVDAASARRLLPRIAGPNETAGVSPWDASGVFTELGVGLRQLPHPSPRTLCLLYAADLAFRVRWQMQPALDEGRLVVAVPYTETLIAFGRAMGLPRPWLVRLLDFAPAPSRCYRLWEPSGAVPFRGFVAFGCRLVAANAGPRAAREVIAKTSAALDRLERRHRCQRWR